MAGPNSEEAANRVSNEPTALNAEILINDETRVVIRFRPPYSQANCVSAMLILMGLIFWKLRQNFTEQMSL